MLTACTGKPPGPPVSTPIGVRVSTMTRTKGARFELRAFEGLQQQGAFTGLQPPHAPQLTESGRDWFAALGVDTDALRTRRRCFCRPYLDWSERRQHLAGALGSALLARVYALGSARRAKDSRVVQFTEPGEYAFRQLFKGAATPPPTASQKTSPAQA